MASGPMEAPRDPAPMSVGAPMIETLLTRSLLMTRKILRNRGLAVTRPGHDTPTFGFVPTPD